MANNKINNIIKSKIKNIVKSIVEMHGGNVRALNRSDVKSGAEIELQLPKRG